MNIAMTGLDFTGAGMEAREKCVFTPRRAGEVLTQIRAAHPEILGCALLSTCNRTELYLSLTEGAEIEPSALLAPWTGGFSLVSRRGENCARYLMEVACGLRSLVFGDEQIAGQVNAAAALAREAGTMDPVLETLLRTAVTMAKAVRTAVRLTSRPASAAALAVEQLAALAGNLQGRSALVIGSGEMGRLAAALLRDAGCAVAVTLRTYRHGESVVPAGCAAVPYDRRYETMDGREILISATASPHYTVTLEALAHLKKPPRWMVDLALPRDIQPEAGGQEGVTLLNLDGLGGGARDVPDEAEDILAEGLTRFLCWAECRENRGVRREKRRFPLFIDLQNRPVLVLGGGKVACRRVETLLQFGAAVTVVSPALDMPPEGIRWERRAYVPGDLAGAILAVAATGDRAVNHAAGEEARRLGIPVSVADAQDECTFFFPAVCLGEGLTAGVVSEGRSHGKTAAAAKRIRTVLEEFT